VNPITRVIDWLGTRNRNLNADMVGVEAATFAARCVTWGLLLSLLAVAWVIVYAFAVVTRATDVATISLMLLLLFGLPIGWLSFRNNSAAARLAADHFESKLGSGQGGGCATQPLAAGMQRSSDRNAGTQGAGGR